MTYPKDFPPTSRSKVEAEKIRAERDFERAKEMARWTTEVEALLRSYILRTYLVFVKEAVAQRLWTVEAMDVECREFLRLLTIDAYYEKGYNKRSGQLLEMTSNWDGSILPRVAREFEKTPDWKQYQDALLEMASPATNSRRTSNALNKKRRLVKKRRLFVLPILARKGWSILEWADESKVNFNTANHYLTGGTRPYKSTRKKLAESLGVDVDQLPL
jgi:hypothetical protein